MIFGRIHIIWFWLWLWQDFAGKVLVYSNDNLASAMPLTAGDIVGRAYRIVRSNIKLTFLTVLGPTLLICAAKIAIALGFGSGALSGAVKTINNPAGIVAAVMGFVTLFIAAYWFYMTQLGLARVFMGYESDIKAALKFVNKQWFTLINLTLLSIVSVFAVLLPYMLTAIMVAMAFKGNKSASAMIGLGFGLGAIIPFILICMISVAVSMAMVSIAFDKDSAFTKFKHAIGMVARAPFRTFGFLCLALISMSLLTAPLSTPLMVAVFAEAFFAKLVDGTMSKAHEVPVFLSIFIQIWESCVNVIASPLYHVAVALFYRDLLIRQEGVDLSARLAALDGA